MRKLVTLLMLGATLLAGMYVAYADNSWTAPYSFLISAPTTTTLTLSWSDSNDVAPDSVSIIDASDSTFYAYVGVSSTDTTLSALSLSPNTAYDFLVRQIRGDSVHVSNADTMWTNRVEQEDRSSIGRMATMRGARSDRAKEIFYDTLYVSNTGSDSTMAYKAAPWMSVQADIGAHADSSKISLRIFGGNTDETNTVREVLHVGRTGEFDYPFAAADSVTLTEPGKNPEWQPNMAACEDFYIRATGDTDNAFATTVILKLYRRWYDGENNE